MRTATRFLLAGPLAAFAWTTAVLAEPGAARVTCRSENFQRAECDAPFRRAELVRQLSRAECREGDTWGQRRGRIWVDRGCAAEFAAGGDGRPGGGPGHFDPGHGAADAILECRSEERRFNRCSRSTAPAHLVEQLSRTDCIEGQTFGVDREGLWVDRGCSGRFSQAGAGHRPSPPPAGGGDHRPGGHRPQPPMSLPQLLTCESHRGRRNTCRFPVAIRQVQLFQQISREPCEENVNWAWRDVDVLEVWDGCGATFRYWPR